MFVNNVAFPAPRLKARIRPSRSGTLWVGSTYPSSGRVLGSTDRKAQKPAAPSFAEEIHLSTEVTCCFWPWPHSFLRCFPPDDREFCHAIEPFHGCMSEHLGTFAEEFHRGRQKRRSGASSVVASGVSFGKRPALLVTLRLSL